MKAKERESYWVIDITCWGTHHAIGTEKQAEEWRRNKARYEGCIARKRVANDEEIADHKIDWEHL